MSLSTERLLKLTSADIGKLSDAEIAEIANSLLDLQQADRRENQLLFYKAASARAGEIHKSRARVIGVGGGNGACVPLEARVLMGDGSWKELGDVVIGDVVMAPDPETGLAAPAPVTNVFRSGLKPVYRVTFSDGGTVEATAEHMIPMYLGAGRTTSKGNPKKAPKRRLGDYIEPIMRRGDRNPSKRIAMLSPADIQAPYIGDLKLPPYTLGALIGDGSMSGMPRLHNDSPEIVERVRAELAPLGVTVVDYDGGDWGLTNTGQVGSNYAFGRRRNIVRSRLEEMGLWGKTSYSKFIPPEAFGLGRTDRLSLLAGLIDTDGGRNSFSTCSDRLADDFVRLIKSLGGKATPARRIARCQNGAEVISNQIYFRLNDRIPLCLTRKQPDLCAGRPIDYQRRICRSAEMVGIKECGDIEVGHAAHCYITGDYVIVSNSKTDTCLAEIAALATGVFPPDYAEDLKAKFRGPVKCRIIIESLTTVLEPTILPKLQWWKWSGVGAEGSDKGHWGWIPKNCLKDGSWDKSFSQKNRILTVLCRDPENPESVLGESTFQFMSHDQDPSDFASGDYHHVLMDEPPRYAIWRENEARTMRVAGRMYLAMTWPDDPTIPVDWIFDEIYDRGTPGPNKHPSVDWFELWTTENRNLDQTAVKAQMDKWDETTKSVRIKGQPIRFSNRIHPLFTDTPLTWSYPAGKIISPEDGKCPETGSTDITEFCHVQDIQPSQRWPTVFILDPHPRKPHMFLWAQVLPDDDIQVILEGAMDADPDALRDEIFNIERAYGLMIADRIMDPNMGASPASAKRNITWQDEFNNVGLNCALADDSDVGRSRINEYLKPDKATLRPRMVFSRSCTSTIFQFKRYVWDNYRRSDEKDLKEKAKPKNDDYPTMLKYLMNTNPSFNLLYRGAPVVRYGRGSDSRSTARAR